MPWFIHFIGWAITSHDVTRSGVYFQKTSPEKKKKEKKHAYSHVPLHQSVDGVDAPVEASEQHDDQDDDDESRKTPAQQEVQQVSTIGVLIIHDEHLPEIHRLWGTGGANHFNTGCELFAFDPTRDIKGKQNYFLRLWL